MAKSKWEKVNSRMAEIEMWAKSGLSEAQIIKNLGIGKTTWEKYKHEHSELSELLKKGRACQVSEVENSVYKNATGYYYFEDQAFKVKDEKGAETIRVVSVKKFKGPETAAACFFLKNKDKKNWSDNPRMIDIREEELIIKQKGSEFKEW